MELILILTLRVGNMTTDVCFFLANQFVFGRARIAEASSGP